MKKKICLLCVVLGISVLSACVEPHPIADPVPWESLITPEVLPTKEVTLEPKEETEKPVEPTKVPEPTKEPEPTVVPVLTEAPVEEYVIPEGTWVPKEAPAVRNAMSDEEKATRQQEILEKGTFLFSGKTNRAYNPMSISWLKEAKPSDAIALVFACDDVTHGGWGVLGISVKAYGIGDRMEEVKAYSDEPDRERLKLYTVEELQTMVGATEPSQLTYFSIGAWNGGRIAGLYYLPEEVVTELNGFLTEVEEAEQIIHTYNGELSNENSIESAKTVYEYLKEVYGTICLTGQMESTWMGSPEYEMNYIKEHTGKLPAIRGFDFIHNDFAGVTKRAKEWWEMGGIPTICWHTGADFSSAYDESKADNINWDEAFLPGTETYNALVAGMDRAVPYLQELEDAGVPVLWRPFHELDGGWFWWSKGGSANFVKLWQLMYSRYTDYWGLDNLIWVLGYSANGGEMAAWYPGDTYVDLIGADSYTAGANGSLYEECELLAPEGIPLVFHECGTIPTEAQMKEAEAPWLFFMTWTTEYLTDSKYNTKESLKEIYNSDYFITLDELPFRVPEATETPVVTEAPIEEPIPTAVPTAIPLPTATPKPTVTPLPTATPKPTVTPLPTATPEPTKAPAPDLNVEMSDNILWEGKDYVDNEAGYGPENGTIELKNIGTKIPTLKEFNDYGVDTGKKGWIGKTADEEGILHDVLGDVRYTMIRNNVIGNTSQAFLYQNYSIGWWWAFGGSPSIELERDPKEDTYTLSIRTDLENQELFGRDLAPWNRDLVKVMLSICVDGETIDEVYNYIYTGFYVDSSVYNIGSYKEVGNCIIKFDENNSCTNGKGKIGQLVFYIKSK